MKDKDLSKDRELKIKKEIEEFFLKSIIVSKVDMDRFGQKEMKKKRPVTNTWYDCLVNYIPNPIKEL